MRILQVTNFFKPSWETGGVTRVCYEISKHLLSNGHDITVYTTDGFDSRLNIQTNKPLNIDGIKVYYFYNLSRILVKRLKLTTPYCLPFVLRKDIQKYDIIHIHEHRTLPAAFVSYFAKKHKIPYILQAHGSVLPFAQKQKLKQIFDLLFGYSILKNASKVIALHDHEKSQYIKMGVNSDKIEIITNGIDYLEHDSLLQKGSFRTKYSIKNEKIVLYVGRLHINKGIDILIESFAELSKLLDGIKLVIVGPDDGYLDYFEQLTHYLNIEDKVIFTGFVTISEKLSAYKDSDVFVTPTFSGFPITFLESCVYGLPIITTNKGDELTFINNNIGYVVEYDVNQIRDAMLRILTNEDIRIQFGKNCQKLVEEEYSLSSIVKKIEYIYQNTIDSNNIHNNAINEEN